jgi:hypothetical protein
VDGSTAPSDLSDFCPFGAAAAAAGSFGSLVRQLDRRSAGIVHRVACVSMGSWQINRGDNADYDR